jgi:ADP-ribose pyrophosphatase YjhB (NUDIX family)
MEDSLYRISVKALIQDESGKTLVVRTGDDRGWTLPGGGVDHGEDVVQGLQREILEELGSSASEIGRTPVVLHSNQAGEGRRAGTWVMWVVYEARLEEETIAQDNAPDGVAYDYIDLAQLPIADVQQNEQALFIKLKELGL